MKGNAKKVFRGVCDRGFTDGRLNVCESLKWLFESGKPNREMRVENHVIIHGVKFRKTVYAVGVFASLNV